MAEVDLSSEALHHLEALARAATPGPWRPCPQKSFIFGPAHEMIASRVRSPDDDEPEEGTVEIRGFGAGLPMDANHDFIVATGPDVVLALIASLRAERSALDAAIGAIDVAIEQRLDAEERRVAAESRPLRDHEKASVFALSVYEDALATGRIDREPALVAGEMTKVLTNAETLSSERREAQRDELERLRVALDCGPGNACSEPFKACAKCTRLDLLDARNVASEYSEENSHLVERGRAAHLALRNVRALAMRIRKTDPENAAHLVRFCESAGVVARVLREGGLDV